MDSEEELVSIVPEKCLAGELVIKVGEDKLVYTENVAYVRGEVGEELA